MNLNNISLPYPVLGISDDILPLLPNDAVAVEVTSDVKKYQFVINLKFENEEIEQLIGSDSAEFSCEYDCTRTMMRNCVKSSNPQFIIEIPRSSINGRINFSCYVSVKKNISNYCNKGFNDDYEGAYFNMETGDILVAFPLFYYDADIKYDKLQVAGSFMQIRESLAHKEVFFDISTNKIEILLPSNLYQLYCNPQVKGATEVIHSSLVLNALVYALLNIEAHEETTWAKTIKYRLEYEDGFLLSELNDVQNIPCLAQRLLKDPYARLFNNIIANSNRLEEE